MHPSQLVAAQQIFGLDLIWKKKQFFSSLPSSEG
jgi:hypothetical protein